MNKAANKNPDGKTLAVISAKIFSAFGLALTLSLAASAQERVLLATQADTPVAQRQDASTIASLSGLQQTAVQAGSVRVIVGLRVPFSQEAWLPASAVAEQRDEIALMQSSMLRRFPSLATAPHSVDRFETIPFMGLTVTPNELADLANSPEVISIERDQLAVPNLHYSVPHIGGNTALASGYSGAGQTVAVLDSGVLKNHSFLQGKVVSEACYSSVSGTTIQSLCPGGATESTAVNSALPCSLDGCDHGTHVAGIVAGSGSSDFSGVAKDAKIIAIQVFSRINDSSVCADLGRPAPCTASRSVDQIKALERVYSLRGLYNIASVNISLGGGNYNGTCDSQQPSVKAIIDQLASVGIATVVASGNNGYTGGISAPACISTAVSVGATWARSGYTNNCEGNYLGTSAVDSVACYSNSSYFLSLLAPGSQIYSSLFNNTYGYRDGTSMAAPHVAGSWAVMKQKNPGATVTEILNTLKNTGTPVSDPRNGIIKPRINLAAALGITGGGTQYRTLSVQTSAGGRINSSPAGIDCGTSCAGSFPNGSYVSLVATPNTGYAFAGWTGACTGYASTCSVLMNSSVNVAATFVETAVQVTLVKAGQGQGTISSNAYSCNQAMCTFTIPRGTILSLAASPGSGSVFSGWSGGNCSGTGMCVITVDSTTTITATFNPADNGTLKYVTPISISNLSGDQNSATIYSVLIPPGARNLQIETRSGTGDLDLYVKYGQQPTLNNWDCRPWVGGNSEKCNFPSPTPGTYYIMTHAFYSYRDASLLVSYQIGNDTKKLLVPILMLMLD